MGTYYTITVSRHRLPIGVHPHKPVGDRFDPKLDFNSLNPTSHYDILIIGGGINGAGIAADASGRGLKVLLCEQNDLASATSGASTKLIHGGLRYLETWEFALVAKALRESDLLLGLAPHLIRPLSFHIPYLPHLRPWLLIRAGLWLYNNLARRPRYPKAGALRFAAGSALKPALTHGFRYYDAQVDDARLVILNAVLAARQGAEIRPRTRCAAVKADGNGWLADLMDSESGRICQVRARCLVNASGPWVSGFVQTVVGLAPRHQVRLVKGSHIVVPAIYPDDQAYLLQNVDGRVVFVIPWQDQRYSLIGTTEEEFRGDPSTVGISTGEIAYLLATVNQYFQRQLEQRDVVSHFAGVRPLIESGHREARKVSRDYLLEFESTPAPVLSIYGGKVTTYRLLAQQAVDQLSGCLGKIAASRSATTILPGGNFQDRVCLRNDLQQQAAWLPADLAARWVASYGTLAFDILRGADSIADLGTDFGHQLFRREVDYLVGQEWARTAEDILWRRSKLGLLFTATETAALTHYLQGQVPLPPGANSR